MNYFKKLALFVLALFISINIFVTSVSADVYIPPCKPGQDPSKDFCTTSNLNNRNSERFDDDTIFIYKMAGITVVTVIVISGRVITKIRKKIAK